MAETNHLLIAQISAMIVKRECDYYSPVEEVQLLLKSKFQVEPTYDEVENILIDLWADNKAEEIIIWDTDLMSY